MNEINIKSAMYLKRPDPLDYDAPYITYAVKATIDGVQMSVPLDPANRHYAAIIKAVEAGELTIEEATP